jgi:hypothetical protein
MSSNQYRRELQRKREQQAAAEKKASDARKKEAAKRGEASKTRASAKRGTTESSRRSRLREAERHDKAANDAGKDVGQWQSKAAGYAKEIATLQARLTKAEQDESKAAERRARSDATTARRRADAEHQRVLRRLSETEAQVTALRELRDPKAERLRILMLAASSEGDLRVGREQSRIRAAVESANHGDLVEFEAKTSATTADLLDGLTKFRPHVVHFSGHSNDELVVFEDDVDDPHRGVVVRAGAFANALGSLSDPPLLVMLNSCRSAAQIEGLVEQVVPFAIGMSDSIDDRDAIAYAARFYASVANGSSLQEAHDLGRVDLELQGLPGADLPQLAHAPDVDPSTTTLVVPPIQEAVS